MVSYSNLLRSCIVAAILAAASLAAQENKYNLKVPDGPFQETWESLKAHQNPSWFLDAKFGIYTHWGPVTVGTEDAPSDMEWYGRQLYMPEHPAFEYHKKKFGDQNKVGYKDIIPLFTATKFNADEWADLFVKSGARFAGPVGVHHDNFAMWDSKVTRWNAKHMGPHRDIAGELEKAYRKHGLKFMMSFHHGFAWRYFEPSYAYDGKDPQYWDLYAGPHETGAPPTAEYQDKWLAMVDEAVSKYKPDLIWFDFEFGTVITPEYQRRLFAHYYNWAAANHRESGVAIKHPEITQYTGILDFERGREDSIKPYPWLTDTALGPWFNHNVLAYRTTADLIDTFVDIVSKNGCLLLNVGPHADGSIPDRAKVMLLAMGSWLKMNGEAIYSSRPWTTYGEGPTRNSGGGFSEEKSRPYTADDIRFTTNHGTLYAIPMAWPANGSVLVKSLAKKDGAGAVETVSLLGSTAKLEWSQTADGLEVKLPPQKPTEYAYVLKINGKGLVAEK